MSHVTDVVLITASDETPHRINEYIQSTSAKHELRLNKIDLDACGGTKHQQLDIWSGAFNHWSDNIQGLIDCFSKIEHREYGDSVLIIQDEHDSYFKRTYSGQRLNAIAKFAKIIRGGTNEDKH